MADAYIFKEIHYNPLHYMIHGHVHLGCILIEFFLYTSEGGGKGLEHTSFTWTVTTIKGRP